MALPCSSTRSFHLAALALTALFLSCSQAAGDPCQVDGDCESGLVCDKTTSALSARGICCASRGACVGAAPIDSGPRVDTGPDEEEDMGPDEEEDMGPDEEEDMGPDEEEDMGPDEEEDMGVRDAGRDAGRDSGPVDMGTSEDDAGSDDASVADDAGSEDAG